jgi:hypothetical protein
MTSAPELDELLLADDAADAARDTIDELLTRVDDNAQDAQAKAVSKGGRRSRKRNNRNKKRVKTLKNKKKYRSSRARRFRSKNKK